MFKKLFRESFFDRNTDLAVCTWILYQTFTYVCRFCTGPLIL